MQEMRKTEKKARGCSKLRYHDVVYNKQLARQRWDGGVSTAELTGCGSSFSHARDVTREDACPRVSRRRRTTLHAKLR